MDNLVDKLLVVLIICGFIVLGLYFYDFGVRHFNNNSNNNDKVLNVEQLYKADSIYNKYIEVCFDIIKLERKISSRATVSTNYLDSLKYKNLLAKRDRIYYMYKVNYDKLDPAFRDEFYLPKPY